MDLNVEVKKSLAIKYGFNEGITKEKVLKHIRVKTIHDWGKAIHLASNGKISCGVGELLARIKHVGETQSTWVDKKKDCIQLCKDIEKQDKLHRRILINESSKYTKAVILVYLQGKTQVEAAKELGISTEDIKYILSAFMYTIRKSYLYDYIIKGGLPVANSQFLIDNHYLSPKTVEKLVKVGILTVSGVKIAFHNCETVESAINTLRKYKNYSDENLRNIVEDLVNNRILDLINLKESETDELNKDAEKKGYLVLNKNEAFAGKIKISTIIIRNMHMTNKVISKAINELVLSNDDNRLDSVRLHSTDNKGRAIYEIVYSKIDE